MLDYSPKPKNLFAEGLSLQNENSLQFGLWNNSYIDEDSVMAEVINAVEGPRHFDAKPQTLQTGPNEDLLLNEESFIGVADFEQEVVKESYINNQIEETLFDDDIMHSLLQGINNEQTQLRLPILLD